MSNVHRIFTNTEKADALAAQLNAEAEATGDDWRYSVIPNPNPDGLKTAIIAITDENGEFVAYL